MMLAGDDELAAVLAEMGGGSTNTNTHTLTNDSNSNSSGNNKDKNKDKRNQAFTDSRLKNPSHLLMEWPEHFRLRESLEPGVCKGWRTGTGQNSTASSSSTASSNSQNNNDKCQACSLSRAFHRLSIATSSINKSNKSKLKLDKKNSPISLLQLLFCHTRNIRCIASENIQCQQNNNYYETISQEIQQLLQQQHRQQQQQQLLSPTDLEAIREKASALHSMVTKQQHSSTTGTSDTDLSERDWRLWIMMKADRLYYRIYYAALTTATTTFTLTNARVNEQDSSTTPIPDPPLYFSFPGLAWKVSTREAKKLCQSLEPTVQQILLDTMGLGLNLDSDNDKGNNKSATTPFSNPLHTLWQHRFYEMARHFHVRMERDDESTSTKTTSKITQDLLNQATTRPDNMHPQFAKHETLAPSRLLAELRDVARDFPASLYAYATPSPRVLQTLQSVLLDEHHNSAKVIEVGAGTGYWAALLQQQCGIHVHPYDVSPPGNFSDNEYHAEVPAFTVIQKLDASVAAVAAAGNNNNDDDDNTALFLCYPPPGTEMAISALQSFAGNRVVHVGEWAGLTGDTAFEACLMERFVCQRYHPIPIWGTDAAYLTVWERRRTRKRDMDTGCIFSAIGGCMACQEKLAVKRCKFARILQYCSQTCFELHAAERKSWLLVHMLDLGDEDVSWSNPRHFMDLASSSTTRSRDDDDFIGGKKKRQNKRRKKRRRSK